MKNYSRGFTKLQMIGALALVFIFVALSVPKVIDIYVKTKESATKTNLDRLRSAVAAYYGDNRGNYPEDDLSVLVPRYIEKIPYVDVQGFQKSGTVRVNQINGKGGWFYFKDKTNPRWGDVVINLPGKDSSGKLWTDN